MQGLKHLSSCSGWGFAVIQPQLTWFGLETETLNLRRNLAGREAPFPQFLPPPQGCIFTSKEQTRLYLRMATDRQQSCEALTRNNLISQFKVGAETILQISDFHSSTLHRWLSDPPTQSYTTEDGSIVCVIDL